MLRPDMASQGHGWRAGRIIHRMTAHALRRDRHRMSPASAILRRGRAEKERGRVAVLPEVTDGWSSLTDRGRSDAGSGRMRIT